jgi:hypothetical protein
MLVTMKRATVIPHAVREERAEAEDERPRNGGDMCDGFMCVSGFEVGHDPVGYFEGRSW